MSARPFVPPPYPYDRLNDLKSEILERHDSVVDLSIGTPFDPPPDAMVSDQTNHRSATVDRLEQFSTYSMAWVDEHLNPPA